VRQETLDGTEVTFNPRVHGLWDRYKQDGVIDHGMWLRACNAVPRDPVGTCRQCGGLLRPDHPRQVGQRLDYEASCVECGSVVAAPGGRLRKGA